MRFSAERLECRMDGEQANGALLPSGPWLARAIVVWWAKVKVGEVREGRRGMREGRIERHVRC